MYPDASKRERMTNTKNAYLKKQGHPQSQSTAFNIIHIAYTSCKAVRNHAKHVRGIRAEDLGANES